MINDNAIRVRSYLIWEREGRPQGRSAEHWMLAKTELAAQAAAKSAKVKARTRKSAVSPTN